MEILFMVFMVVVSIMALFAVMVVFRDIVREILAERRERNNCNNTATQAERPVDSTPVTEPATVTATTTTEESVTTAKPVAVEAAVVTDAPVETTAETVTEAEATDTTDSADDSTVVAAETTETPAEDAEGMISFSMGQQQTLEEKYLALPAEQRRWYDEIIKYASAVEGSKRFKNVRYEEYKVGKNRLVRLLIKRGIIHCEFILHNSDFKNYINENRISVRQSATTMLVESAATVEAVKNSIDIVVAAIAEEREYKKKLARERRRAARASETTTETTETTEAKPETPVGV